MSTPKPRSLLTFALVTACASTPARPPAPASTPAAPAAAASELVAIDMFGTRQISREQLLAAREAELRAYFEAMIRDDPAFDIAALVAGLDKLGDFATVAPALIGYYEPGGMKYYLTVDFVDRADAARRMPFLPALTGAHVDPAGLIADWITYETRIFALMGAGEMSPQRVACPAFHCIGDGTHPQVKALADRFAAQVPAHVDALAAILRDDRDARRRAAAVYLLAYAADGPALVQQAVGAFRDRDSLVRNNAMRVVVDIAAFHPGLEVPLEPVLAALDYPTTADRNKASAILDGLLARPGAAARHPEVIARAGATLLAMLRLEQPNNHDFAYSILKALSDQSFGERDYAAWDAWLASARR